VRFYARANVHRVQLDALPPDGAKRKLTCTTSRPRGARRDHAFRPTHPLVYDILVSDPWRAGATRNCAATARACLPGFTTGPSHRPGELAGVPLAILQTVDRFPGSRVTEAPGCWALGHHPGPAQDHAGKTNATPPPARRQLFTFHQRMGAASAAHIGLYAKLQPRTMQPLNEHRPAAIPQSTHVFATRSQSRTVGRTTHDINDMGALRRDDTSASRPEMFQNTVCENLATAPSWQTAPDGTTIGIRHECLSFGPECRVGRSEEYAWSPTSLITLRKGVYTKARTDAERPTGSPRP